MDAEIKSRWVQALRSGDYEQGEGYLNKDGKFCCLGVLCELAAADGVVNRLTTPDAVVTAYGDPRYTGFPAAEVAEWAGLEGVDPVVVTGCNRHSLSSLNDDGRTFAEIADLIEEQL